MLNPRDNMSPEKYGDVTFSAGCLTISLVTSKMKKKKKEKKKSFKICGKRWARRL